MDNGTFRYDIKSLVEEMDVEYAAISTLYSEYFFEMKGNVQDSRLLCTQNAWDKLQRVVHNMKGISISLNIKDIYDASYKLDIELKGGNYTTASASIDTISNLLVECENDIKHFFQQKGIVI